MIQVNPYRRNCEVIKKFFSNPVILIISILFFISAIASVTVSLIVESQPTVPVIELLFAIGFLLFYIKGRKNSEITSFALPINTLTVASIISIVVNALILVTTALLLVLKYSFNLQEKIFSDISAYISYDPIYMLTLYSPICLVSLITAIVMLVLLSSIKKSTTSIYLYKKGSLSFAIANFVFAVLQIGYIVYEGISIASIALIIEVITLIMLGVFAIMYYRYITNVSSNISIPKPVAETINSTPQPHQAPVAQPIDNATIPTANDYVVPRKSSKHTKSPKNIDYGASLVNMWNTPEPPSETKDFSPQSASFDPQPVFAQPTPDYSYPDSPILSQDNPLPVQTNNVVNNIEQEQPFVQRNATPIAPVQPAKQVTPPNPAPVEQTKEVAKEESYSFCTFCGKKCPPENLYCGACGNKLTK